ncbi:MAG: hypothetical protein FWD34_06745 [Oscillospiraceae bacterium]|nr:hypothetical protein [Oscillospiraceae bacterium]
MIKCSSCGHDNEGAPKFCGKCGNPTATPAVPAPAPVEPVPAPVVSAQVPVEPVVSAQAPVVSAQAPVPPVVDSIPATAPVEIQPAAVEAVAVVPVSGTDSGSKKKILIIGGIAVVVIFILGLILAGGLGIGLGGGGGTYPKFNDFVIFEGDEKTIILYGNGGKVEINEEFYRSNRSLDGKRALILTDYDAEDGGTLYYVTGKGKPERISNGVFDFKLSDSGKGFIFWTDYESSDRTARLNHQIGGTKKTIDNGIHFDNSSLAISPDGKTVVYIKDYEYDEDEYIYTWSLFASTNGNKGERIGRAASNITPIAVSNGGKFLYYFRDRDDGTYLFVKKGLKAEDELRLGQASGDNYFLNKDYSQLVYTSDDATYITVKGGEKTKICNGKAGYFVTPKGTQARGGRATVYGFSNFKKKVFYLSGDLNLITNKFEREKICSNADASITMTEDGKWIFYRSYNSSNSTYNLRRVSATKADADSITVARRVESFVVSKNGSTVYFVNDEQELMTKKATNEDDTGKKVADDVNNPGSLSMTTSGTVFFITDYSRGEGTLQMVKGTTRTKIRDDVTDVYVLSSNVLYFLDDDGDATIFRSNGNNNFTQFAKEIDW